MCELCVGTLLAGPVTCPTCGENGLDCLGYDVGEEHVCGTVLPGTPCPRCLSVPATPELLDGWNGPVVLDRHDRCVVLGPADPWVDDETEEVVAGVLVYHIDGSGCREPGDVGAVAVCDLALDATCFEVRDRLARDLARMLGLEVGATAPAWYWAPSWRSWVLAVWDERTHMMHTILFSEHAPLFITGPGSAHRHIPTFATIPADAPADLCGDRALVLAHQEVSHAV